MFLTSPTSLVALPIKISFTTVYPCFTLQTKQTNSWILSWEAPLQTKNTKLHSSFKSSAVQEDNWKTFQIFKTTFKDCSRVLGLLQLVTRR